MHTAHCSRNYFDAVFDVIHRLKLKVDAGAGATCDTITNEPFEETTNNVSTL